MEKNEVINVFQSNKGDKWMLDMSKSTLKKQFLQNQVMTAASGYTPSISLSLKKRACAFVDLAPAPLLYLVPRNFQQAMQNMMK